MNQIISNIKSIEIYNIISIFQKGGIIMYPLFLLSFISVYIIIYKIIELSFISKIPKQWYENLYNSLNINDEKKTKDICRQRSSNILSKTIISIIGKIKEDKIKDRSIIIYNETKKTAENLEKKINLLQIISGAAPMLGFLGTVTGMITSFIKISHIKTQINPSLLSTGIYEAMITTATGLAISIISYLFYNFFTLKVNSQISKLEYYISDLNEVLEKYDRTIKTNQSKENKIKKYNTSNSTKEELHPVYDMLQIKFLLELI